jgi:hypothetical protein
MCQRGQGCPGKRANRVVGWRGVRREMPADFEEAYTILEERGRFYKRVCVGGHTGLVAQPDCVCFCISNSKTFLSHEQGKVGILIIKPDPNRETMTHEEMQAKLRPRQIALVKV